MQSKDLQRSKWSVDQVLRYLIGSKSTISTEERPQHKSYLFFFLQLVHRQYNLVGLPVNFNQNFCVVQKLAKEQVVGSPKTCKGASGRQIKCQYLFSSDAVSGLGIFTCMPKETCIYGGTGQLWPLNLHINTSATRPPYLSRMKMICMLSIQIYFLFKLI